MDPSDTNLPLMPYASHVAEGTGRTPIGIILFACGHLLLGAVLLLMLASQMRHLPPMSAGEIAVLALWPSLAIAMLVGGTTLLLKGSIAWRVSALAFVCSGLVEALFAAEGVRMLVRYAGTDEGTRTIIGVVAAGVLSLLLGLDVVVLKYLAAAKGRATFGLPPGETPRNVRWASTIVTLAWVVAIAIGVSLAVSQR